ncbi:MAG TPA: hypothetical protein VM532_02530 [Burkholderiales bacterium]|nr:hypothetical protein [Burkholderiales bacterium]
MPHITNMKETRGQANSPGTIEQPNTATQNAQGHPSATTDLKGASQKAPNEVGNIYTQMQQMQECIDRLGDRTAKRSSSSGS